MKIIKNIFYTLVSIIQVALLVGMFVVNYFTTKKMGMYRFVAYKNIAWENNYPINQLSYIAIAVAIVFTIVAYMIYNKNKSKLDKKIKIENIIMIVLTVSYVLFLLFVSTEVFKSYYFMAALFGLCVMIQLIKTLIVNIVKVKRLP